MVITENKLRSLIRQPMIKKARFRRFKKGDVVEVYADWCEDCKYYERAREVGPFGKVAEDTTSKQPLIPVLLYGNKLKHYKRSEIQLVKST